MDLSAILTYLDITARATQRQINVKMCTNFRKKKKRNHIIILVNRSFMNINESSLLISEY